jgi:hypothetical protein
VLHEVFHKRRPGGIVSFASQGLALPCSLIPGSDSCSKSCQQRLDLGLNFLAFGPHGVWGGGGLCPSVLELSAFPKQGGRVLLSTRPFSPWTWVGSMVIVQSRCRPILQVKIWFQNKRSKFKKLMKQGGAALEGSALANGRALSAGSPPVPPGWNPNSSSGKGSGSSAGSYVPSYTSWYPSAHQEAMQQPQLM